MKKILRKRFPNFWRAMVWMRWAPVSLCRDQVHPVFARLFRGKRSKRRAESAFWRELYETITNGCSTEEDRLKALLANCHEDSFERYQKFLHVDSGSFAGMRVLDVGCGPTCGLIGFNDCEKYGVDHLIDTYREIGFPLDQHGVVYFNARLERTGLESAAFDRVLCVNALDHVDNLRVCVKEIARLLKPGGELLAQIGFHNKPTPTEPIVMQHDRLLKYSRRYGLRPLQIQFIDQSEYLDEFRYFYRLIKD